MTETTLYRLEEAGVTLGGRVLLHPLSMELPAGRVIGLIGHNGSGKSTLLRLLAHQMAPDAGRILFEGQPLPAWNRRALARRIAYLPQYTPAAEGLTVRELVAHGRYPWHGALGRFGAEDRRMVEVALGLTGMDSYADRMVDRLSGGERQRAWLAMLLAQDARCILLDEPISALDLRHQIELLSLIRRLNQEHGLSVVLVIHDVNMAARFCDEILALHSGHLILRGDPASIMRPEQLETIYGVPFDSLRDPRSGRDICFVS